ncbi:hypothetical protein CC2G_003534 [Coprinopsis cinerea AmutBmut pab1-1]|nr:hypothetical protein CC2G_003534 [Coprinopsis cinerea AmutBmut pab1-1]
MQFTHLALLLTTTITSALAQQQFPIVDERRYCTSTERTTSTACGNLVSQFPTFGSFPSFPVIGGAEFITQSDDPDCGSCFNITSIPTNGGGPANTVFLTAINTAPRGFVVCTDVLTDLLNLPRGSPVPPNVQVEATRVDASLCGL